ncbi:hypothetical protein BOV88_13725 [Solemya velum gill symbiont]|uniref:Uncharacterized protein n=1 Tax=Solemya velum gill symbiont TaxID=2340 RepID=A0A1T2CFS6_SOVGS|nr:hypothetical protein [Solemya velum gill symbiont]OOY33730.1 hypothetical protein BOV88_13725 [Solemya velum gill symbiont]OOY45228.1 hypothetical protein BOV93_13500 [Solemya velum gill symbiont]
MNTWITDASIKAYGFAAYLCQWGQSAFIMAESRVALLKGLTLPKLELMAAAIGTQLANHIEETLKPENIIF